MKLIITDIEDFNILIKGEHKVIKPNGNIRHCIGCFGCWVKTPGKCVLHDGYEETGVSMGKCTELIFVSRCYYGSVSPFVKMVQDRAISYIHPDLSSEKERCTINGDIKTLLHCPYTSMAKISQIWKKKQPEDCCKQTQIIMMVW